MAGWQFWIDRGGTFTDIVALRPDGRLETAKLLSNAPDLYADAALAGIARLRGDDPAPIAAVRMGTTVATNALLERKGEPTLLAITAGHADALLIGHQARPRIFALDIQRPAPLHGAVVELPERVTADGRVLRPLDAAATHALLAAAFAAGWRSIAIACLHGHAHPAHEQQVAAIARAIGFTQVTASHQVGAVIRLVPRAATAVVDAYLSPPLAAYVDQVAAGLAGVRLDFMQSGGGLARAGHFHGRDAILSGPAGGIVGMAAAGRSAGLTRLIGFDMGGTSTDVALFDGAFERADDVVIAGITINVPMLRIDTVAAGGGSIISLASGRLKVGPHSAGALPGPAAYRRGGPLTITDANVMLGILQPDFFPALFGPAGNEPLDAAAVRAGFADLAAQMGTTPEQAAAGALAIAVETMAQAIARISIARGHDVAAYTLTCFGGAGGQHACKVADALGMGRVLVHPLAGVLSAWGIGLAENRAVRQRSLNLALGPGLDLAPAAEALAAEAAAVLTAQGEAVAAVRLSAVIRYAGSDSGIELPLAAPDAMAAEFAEAQSRRFGFVVSGADLVVDRLIAEAVGPAPDAATCGQSAAASAPDAATTGGFAGTRALYLDSEWRDTPVWHRHALPPGWERAGPALILDASATTLVEPGWTVRVDAALNLILTRTAPLARASHGTGVDPIRLELFANRFMAIAEDMGEALKTTAWSVNIKERLDFSCAIFDAAGHLVANAPHMPVHLGSMGDSVRTVMQRWQASPRGIRPGDAFVLNNPYAGGTHLPDVTVVAPVFLAEGAMPAFWVAARGHQADIGGITPGSMPPDSTHIDQEGVMIDNTLLIDQGNFLESEMLALLASGPWPARDPARCLGDLKAQAAACARGAAALKALCASEGAATVAAFMAHVQDDAEAAVRAAISGLSDGACRIEMDNGGTISVAVRIDREAAAATIDFTGTSAQLPSNFNAPYSVAQAAVLYVFRCLAGSDLPMNDGCMRPLTLLVPDGCLLRPVPPAAVVAGNVETSQIITDALFGAVGRLAASQGTMNNFTFGNNDFQYYETICGGAGAGVDSAGRGFAGASAVQTHMTNSRLTDPEVLESRFPVLVERFAVRRGSGGAGRWPGGDGVVRHIRALTGMTASLLSGRRATTPFGLAGGGPALPGTARVQRVDGTVEILPACARVELAAGDAIIIETPGGGGFGGPA